ncbi:MAG: secondary thiamine-phosphate synthase enzyme YjbQ [bacterium]
MEIITEHLSISTHGNAEIVDITDRVARCLKQHSLSEGSVLLFVVGSTASLTTTEYEPGMKRDIPEAMERIAPQAARYHHDETWHDGNGHSHVRASLLGPSLTIPFLRGALLLGTWQQIVLIDFDTRPRERKIVIQLFGK